MTSDWFSMSHFNRSPSSLVVALAASLGFVAATLLGASVPSSWARGNDVKVTYTECFGARTWQISGRDVNRGELPDKVLKVPSGWTAIAGAGRGGDVYVILCR